MNYIIVEKAQREFEERFRAMQQENLRLNTTLMDRLKEIEMLKSKIEPDPLLYQQIEELHSRLRALEYENNLLKGSSGSRGVLHKSPSGGEVAKLQEKISLLVGENERINHLLLEKSRGLDKMTADMTKHQKESRVKIEDLEERILILNGENQRLNGVLDGWKKALDEAQGKIQELTGNMSELEDYKSKLRFIVEENDRLNQLLNEKIREIKELKRLCSDRTDLEQQVVKSKRENQRLSELLDDAVKNLEHTKNVMNSLERVQVDNKDLRDETQRLAELLERKTHECEGLKTNCLDLSHKIEEFDRKNQNLAKENEEKARRIADLQLQSESLQNQLLQENMQVSQALVVKDNELVQVKMRCADLEHAANRINEEKEQINQLLTQLNSRWLTTESSYESPSKFARDQTTNSYANLKKLATSGNLKDVVSTMLSEIDKLATQNTESKKELERYQKEAGKVRELTDTIDLLQDENEKVSRKLADKSRECDQMKSKLAGYQENVSKIPYLENELESAYRHRTEIQEKFTIQQSEYDNLLRKKAELELQKQTLERELMLQQNRVESLEGTVDGVRKENNQLSQKIRELEKTIEAAQRTSDTLQKEVERLRRMVQSNDSERDETMNQVRELERHIKELIAENDNLSRMLNEKTHALQDLEARMTLLDQAASRTDELDVLVTKLRAENLKLAAITEQKELEIENLKSNSGLIPQLQTKINQLAAENASLIKDVANLEIEAERCKDLEEAVKKIQNRNKSLQEENSELEQKLNEAIARETLEFKAKVASGLGKRSLFTTSPMPRRSFEGPLDPNDGGIRESRFEKSPMTDQGALKRNKSDIFDPVTPLRGRDLSQEDYRDRSQEKRDYSQSKNHQAEIARLNNLVADLKQDNERLNELLGKQYAEISELKSRIDDLKHSSRHPSPNKENRELMQDSLQKDQLIRQLQMKIAQLENSVEQIPTLDNKIRAYIEEKEQLEEMLKEKERELFRIRNLLKEIEMGIRQGGDLKKKLDLIQKEGREDFPDSQLFGNSRVRELERNLRIMTEDNQRLQELLEERTQELDRINNLLNASPRYSHEPDLTMSRFENRREIVSFYLLIGV